MSTTPRRTPLYDREHVTATHEWIVRDIGEGNAPGDNNRRNAAKEQPDAEYHDVDLAIDHQRDDLLPPNHASSVSLPDEILALVLSHLAGCDIAHAGAVSSQWRRAVLDPVVWRRVVLKPPKTIRSNVFEKTLFLPQFSQLGGLNLTGTSLRAHDVTMALERLGKNLRKLDLSDSVELTSAGVSSFAALCPALQSLGLRRLRHASSSFIDGWAEHAALRALDLRGTDAAARVLDRVPPSLTSLKLRVREMPHPRPSLNVLGKRCPKLTSLLVDAAFADIDFHNFPHLQYYETSWYYGFDTIEGSPLLETLRLTAVHNPQYPASNATLLHLVRSCPKLRVLSMPWELTDAPLTELALHAACLERVELDSCSLTDVGVDALLSLPSLRVLTLGPKCFNVGRALPVHERYDVRVWRRDGRSTTELDDTADDDEVR